MGGPKPIPDYQIVRDHPHPHADHDPLGDHSHDHSANETRLAIAAVLTGLFMFAEVAGGFLSGSLALIADAGHMLTDFGSLLLAWFGFRLARRPADDKRSYGYGRFQILMAFANGITLLAVVVWITVEAVQRLIDPNPVEAELMLWVAVAGLVVNIAVFAILHGGAKDNLNMRGAIVHVLGDLLGSVAAILGALIIMATGFLAIDPILSLVVALLLARSAWYVTTRAAHILLEGTPQGIDVGEIAADLDAVIDGAHGVHHIHVWSLTQEARLCTLHVCVMDAAAAPKIVVAIKRRLSERFSIDHATVEVDLVDSREEASRLKGHTA